MHEHHDGHHTHGGGDEGHVHLESRRSFLLSAARGAAALGLVVAGGFMIGKRLDYLEDCEGHRICDACGVYNGCELPYKQPVQQKRHSMQQKQHSVQQERG